MEDYRLEQSGQEVQEILNGAAMQVDLTEETERATEAEQTLQGNIDAEATRATEAEGTLQGNIDAEEDRAKAAEKQNADDIDAIEEKIPSGASSSNKLATEEYVADAVATATATFRGTYNLVSDLHLNVTATEQQIAAALAGAISTADNNDYCFIQVPTSSETPTEIKEIDRYKFNGTAWAFEYKLNNSGFTAAQWAAINSGITSGDVAKLAALPTNAQLTTLLAGLQSDIDGEETRAKGAEGTLQDNIDAEEARAKAAEKQNADDIDAIDEKIPSVASSSNKLATESDINSLSAAIEAILLLIPSAATSLNKLADKAFVNSSIATATATFRGTYNLVDDLGLTTSATHAQIATALAGAILTADNNDYAFVQIPTSDAMPTEIAKTERYKFNGTAWEYEYDLNNSGFTADQWAAINSGITQALKAKLSDLPTNAELTTELGTLTSGITTINQKIPNAASQANKLVDTAAMESYIVQVLDVLTASFNVTSTDGHVTVQISQVDGKITSVAVSTSDIASAADLNLKASQADLTALASRVTTAEGNITSLGGRMTTAEGNITSLGGRMTTAEGNITSLGGRVSTNETDIEDLKAAYAGLTQSDIIIGALPASGVANKIYRVPGTNSYSDYMWNGTQFVLMATYNNAIDPRPKKASQNLVTSGGVFDNMGALDVSELNATENPHTLAKYVDLSAALAAIPTDYQKGGMSIKFVQSSDNNYRQCILLTQTFSINPNDWLVLNEKAEKIDYVFNNSNIIQGAISNQGVEQDVPTRVKFSSFVESPFILKIDEESDIEGRILKYEHNGTFIGISTDWSKNISLLDTSYKYKIMFRFSDNSNIVPSDIYSVIGTDIKIIATPIDWENEFYQKVEELESGIIYFNTEVSANIHNSAAPTPASSSEPTDGSDWAGHIVSTTGSISANASYNVSYYIAVEAGVQYKCNVDIRRIGYYKSDKTPVSTADNVSSGTAIIIPANCAFVRISYDNDVTSIPGNVKFGKYTDNIDVPYFSETVDYDSKNRRLALYEELHGQKIITSVGSSGFDVNCGGQYCLTEAQKQTYDVTNDLCATRVVQKLLGYDKANVCAYSGVPASLIFFRNGSSPLILKNSVTLISGTAVPYTFDLTNIGAPMTQSLSVLETSDIGTFDGILNGYNVTVNAVSGTITLNDAAPANVIIPAGGMLYRNVYTRTTAGSSTVTAGLRGSSGLIIQIGANSEGDTPEEIFSYCELAIKESGCKWFVVLRQNTQGDLDYETAETTGWSDLNKAAKLLRTKYGSMFLDHMAYMTSRKSLSDQGITPTTSALYPDENGQNSNPLTAQQIEHNIPCDIECIATRRVPSSFWYGAWRADDVPTNEGHFNAQGLECLGKYIYTMVHRMGF